MKSIWIASYENNEVKVENTWFNGERLYVNGILQDERFGFFSSQRCTTQMLETKPLALNML